MKKHFGTILIIAGILIIAVPLAGRFIAARRQAELMDSFLEELEEGAETSSEGVDSGDLSELSDVLNWGALEDNQTELAIGIDEARATVDDLEAIEDSADGTNLTDAERIKVKPEAVATMRINKIGVYLPVAEGADLATLKFSLGHMPETAPLGNIGNAVVAGHRSHSFGSFFNRLDEVEVGDTIEVQVKGGDSYTYEVYETLIVEPDDLSVLRNSSKHRVLTLITCTPLYTSTHRLIVHAVVREES